MREQYETTYRELIVRVNAIQSVGNPPLAQRPFRGVLTMAIRRFLRDAKGPIKDFQAARDMIVRNAPDLEPNEEGNITNEEVLAAIADLLDTGIEMEVTKVPTSHFDSENVAFSVYDLDVLEPILSEEEEEED